MISGLHLLVFAVALLPGFHASAAAVASREAPASASSGCSCGGLGEASSADFVRSKNGGSFAFGEDLPAIPLSQMVGVAVDLTTYSPKCLCGVFTSMPIALQVSTETRTVWHPYLNRTFSISEDIDFVPIPSVSMSQQFTIEDSSSSIKETMSGSVEGGILFGLFSASESVYESVSMFFSQSAWRVTAEASVTAYALKTNKLQLQLSAQWMKALRENFPIDWFASLSKFEQACTVAQRLGTHVIDRFVAGGRLEYSALCMQSSAKVKSTAGWSAKANLDFLRILYTKGDVGVGVQVNGTWFSKYCTSSVSCSGGSIGSCPPPNITNPPVVGYQAWDASVPLLPSALAPHFVPTSSLIGEDHPFLKKSFAAFVEFYRIEQGLLSILRAVEKAIKALLVLAELAEIGPDTCSCVVKPDPNQSALAKNVTKVRANAAKLLSNAHSFNETLVATIAKLRPPHGAVPDDATIKAFEQEIDQLESVFTQGVTELTCASRPKTMCVSRQDNVFFNTITCNVEKSPCCDIQNVPHMAVETCVSAKPLVPGLHPKEGVPYEVNPAVVSAACLNIANAKTKTCYKQIVPTGLIASI